jgi:myo-inositol-1(or 4)-monophosphatase
MTASDLDHRLNIASAVAREAGAVARERFTVSPQTFSHTFKSDQDYLTETDAELERLIRDRLASACPGDSFFGEESGGTFGSNVWIVDPIDGTANFARGIPHFCISIAFVRDHKAEIGVIYKPMTDELYAARRDAGATRNGQRIKVSAIADIRQSTVEAGWSTRLPPEPYVVLVDRLIKAGAQVRRAGSGALALAYVADGRIDAYCELHINAWDALAGLVLIEEAGGWTNDFLAGDGLRRGNAVLGCTPALKDVIGEAMGFAAAVDAASAKG